MLSERLTGREIQDTMMVALLKLAEAQGATVTMTRENGGLEIFVALPEGKQYDFGHTGFGASTKNGDYTEFDVWHDVLVGISYSVIDSEFDDDDLCDSCKEIFG